MEVPRESRRMVSSFCCLLVLSSASRTAYSCGMRC
jgi:hypothetical protein